MRRTDIFSSEEERQMRANNYPQRQKRVIQGFYDKVQILLLLNCR